ncbi:WXG100-like domain-containing protein, partial [Nocardia sp. NPDC003345]
MIDIPGWAQHLAILAGVEWPEGNEDEMWGLGGDWRAAGDELDDIVADIIEAKRASLHAYPEGDGVTEMIKAFDSLISGDGSDSDQSVPKLADSFRQLGDAAYNTGTEIEYTKLMYLSSLALLAAEIAAAFIFPPAAPAVQAAAVAVTRLAVRLLLQRVLQTILRIASNRFVKFLLRHMAIDTILGTLQEVGIQGWQIKEGHRPDFDLGQIAVTVVASAAGGAAAGPVGDLIGNALARETSGILRRTMDGMITGTGAGLVGGLAGTAAAIPAQFAVIWHQTGSFDQAMDQTMATLPQQFGPLGIISGASNGLFTGGAKGFSNSLAAKRGWGVHSDSYQNAWGDRSFMDRINDVVNGPGPRVGGLPGGGDGSGALGGDGGTQTSSPARNGNGPAAGLGDDGSGVNGRDGAPGLDTNSGNGAVNDPAGVGGNGSDPRSSGEPGTSPAGNQDGPGSDGASRAEDGSSRTAPDSGDSASTTNDGDSGTPDSGGADSGSDSGGSRQDSRSADPDASSGSTDRSGGGEQTDSGAPATDRNGSEDRAGAVTDSETDPTRERPENPGAPTGRQDGSNEGTPTSDRNAAESDSGTDGSPTANPRSDSPAPVVGAPVPGPMAGGPTPPAGVTPPATPGAPAPGSTPAAPGSTPGGSSPAAPGAGNTPGGTGDSRAQTGTPGDSRSSASADGGPRGRPGDRAGAADRAPYPGTEGNRIRAGRTDAEAPGAHDRQNEDGRAPADQRLPGDVGDGRIGPEDVVPLPIPVGDPADTSSARRDNESRTSNRDPDSRTTRRDDGRTDRDDDDSDRSPDDRDDPDGSDDPDDSADRNPEDPEDAQNPDNRGECARLTLAELQAETDSDRITPPEEPSGPEGMSRDEIQDALGGNLYDYPDRGPDRPRHQAVADELLRQAARTDPRLVAAGKGPRAFVIDEYAGAADEHGVGAHAYSMTVRMDPLTGEYRIEVSDPAASRRRGFPPDSPAEVRRVSATLLDGNGRILRPTGHDGRVRPSSEQYLRHGQSDYDENRQRRETEEQYTARRDAEAADLRSRLDRLSAQYLRAMADHMGESGPSPLADRFRDRADEADRRAEQHRADADDHWDDARRKPETRISDWPVDEDPPTRDEDPPDENEGRRADDEDRRDDEPDEGAGRRDDEESAGRRDDEE